MGLLAAVEVFVKRDHEADQNLWNGRSCRASLVIFRGFVASRPKCTFLLILGFIRFLTFELRGPRALPLSYADCARNCGKANPASK